MTRPGPGTRTPPGVSSHSCDPAGVLGLGRVPRVSDSGSLATTGLMGTSTVEQLLENVCLLLASRTRDVVKSALGFIKVAVVVMDVVHLAKHVQLVVSAPLHLGRWPHVQELPIESQGALRPASVKHLSCVLSCATDGGA